MLVTVEQITVSCVNVGMKDLIMSGLQIGPIKKVYVGIQPMSQCRRNLTYKIDEFIRPLSRLNHFYMRVK